MGNSDKNPLLPNISTASKSVTRCSKCKGVVTKGVAYKEGKFHRECFTCTECRVSLAGVKFFTQGNEPFCRHCYGERFADKCNGCNEPILEVNDLLYIFFEKRSWHLQCFACGHCTTSLVGELAVAKGLEIICTACSEKEV